MFIFFNVFHILVIKKKWKRPGPSRPKLAGGNEGLLGPPVAIFSIMATEIFDVIKIMLYILYIFFWIV